MPGEVPKIATCMKKGEFPDVLDSPADEQGPNSNYLDPTVWYHNVID
jgi:hypothetical protein